MSMSHRLADEMKCRRSMQESSTMQLSAVRAILAPSAVVETAFPATQNWRGHSSEATALGMPEARKNLPDMGR